MVRSDRPIDVHAWDEGRTYPAHIAQNVFAQNGDLAIPAGAAAELVAHKTGPNQMGLELEFITVNGGQYTVNTSGAELQANTDASGVNASIPVYSTLRFRLTEPVGIFD